MLLAIETASELAGVALADADGPRAGAWLTGGRRHAEALAPSIVHVLEQAGASLADVHAVAVDVGPGLFTGLRVGIATAQGLAQGLGIGIVPATSTSVLARRAYDAGWDGEVLAVVDARRNEVFCARYDGATHETRPPARYRPEVLAAELAAESAVVPAPGLITAAGSARRPILAVGNGARRYEPLLAAAGVRVAAIRDPSPEALAALATGRLASGAEPVPPTEIRPVYLREADARINWAHR